MSELLLTVAQMRALEQAAIESGAVTGLELMERAGVGAVAAIEAEWPELARAPGRAVVLCGPGNNGGDGFVVARVLAGKGWDVQVFLYGDAAKLPSDARVNCERWCEMGEVKLAADIGNDSRDVALFVDALFGIGLSRPLDEDGQAALDGGLRLAHSSLHGRAVVLDLVSGRCADSGTILGSTRNGGDADLTIAFGCWKLGHFLSRSAEVCGKPRLLDIGIDPSLWRKAIGQPYDQLKSKKSDFSMIARLETGEDLLPGFSDAKGLLDKGWYGEEQHKYDHGHALILTGGLGRTGAARLAARAALRIGAGVVTCAAPGAAMMECATQLTAIMLRRCDDAAALAGLLEDDRINALCLGPGMGVSDRTSALLDVALASGRKLVLDADALTVLAGRDDPFAGLDDDCVLTPHGGEFARLFPDIAERLNAPAMTGPAYSKVDATRDAAARAGCTVLFKGPDTVIADASGNAHINAAVYDRAAPWLATAGAGDVLAGIITGLLARGFGPIDAASSAAWLHVEAARAFGPGLIAEDLPEMLPKVLRALQQDD